jgi:hypothetical protein
MWVDSTKQKTNNHLPEITEQFVQQTFVEQNVSSVKNLQIFLDVSLCWKSEKLKQKVVESTSRYSLDEKLFLQKGNTNTRYSLTPYWVFLWYLIEIKKF